ncbi:hypothetical protein PTTG_25461 [Puccinia triticina 1-1 BBBD Race 1]|uniref:Uncharacterized protein n=1 Tax=Puccinia triticina (isolate 1-1 / race 1 (BBBD)) TaxID=630390 RepID=A0A180H2C1_PUCT1|nr:hypothetical protein PTTG_25461 [Puccinia triticina 1-1 BBBD Race 1]
MKNLIHNHPRSAGVVSGVWLIQSISPLCQDSGQAPVSGQDSGQVPVSRKRKEPNPNPARGIATSSIDEEPKRYKQTQAPSSTLASDAIPDRTGPSLSDRITTPISGEEVSSGSLASRIGRC